MRGRSRATGRYLEAVLGHAIREARRARGWTQSELGRRIGVSQSVVSRLERGVAPCPRLDIIGAALEALGVTVRVELEAPFLAQRRHSRDRAHAFLQSFVLRRLPADWLREAEVEVGRGRHPGWIDILAFHPPTGTLLVIEIKTELEDVGATLRTLEWYAREAETRARQLGWRPRRVVRLLVALATTDVERRIREAKRLLANALPARAEALDSLLAEPSRGLIADGRQVGGGLALIDPLRRRARWLQRAAIDGGRSRRYPDYAGFVSAMDQRSGRKPRRAAA